MIEKIRAFYWKAKIKIRIAFYEFDAKIFKRLARTAIPDHELYTAFDLIAWDFRDAIKDLEKELENGIIRS